MPRRKSRFANPPAAQPQPITPAPADPWPRYLTAKRAAAYLSMSYMTFYRWSQRAVVEGLLHVDRSTKSWRYDRLELDRAWAIRAGVPESKAITKAAA